MRAESTRGETLNTEQYLTQFVPRVPSQPWSAPFYDEIARPSTPPRVFCMISGGVEEGTCSCLTEQGTKYTLGLDQCRAVAINGQYEPYLEPTRYAQGERSSTASAELESTRERDHDRRSNAEPVGAITPFGEMHKYGALELALGAK